MREPIYHVAHDLDLDGHPDRERILNARQTWEVLRRIDGAWQPVWFNTEGKRTSRDLGDTRQVPYVNDLFDAGVQAAGEDGIVCWLNLDVCLVPETAIVIRQKLGVGPCCYSARVDVDNAHVRRSARDLLGQRVGLGTDLFAFRSSWWLSYREEFPDMFISCEAFDFMLRKLMDEEGSVAEIMPPILYHQQHLAYWTLPENRRNNPAQRHNRAIATQWCNTRGMECPF